jgi:hypothetical protein
VLGNRRERSDGRDDDLRIGRTIAGTTGRRGGRIRWRSEGEIRGMASKTKTVRTTTKDVTKRDLIWSHH